MTNQRNIPFASLGDIVEHLRTELDRKQFILLFAYNSTGKTRLSMAFKDKGKNGDARDTLYFNAFTEDLFFWNNDLDDDSDRRLMLNSGSRFFQGIWELEMDTRIRSLLHRYADFDFRIDTEEWAVRFSREVDGQVVDNIKVSRGEERIFIWCFFLAIVELALDPNIYIYRWVKYIYIDDPISSLDEHNAIVVANHLVQLFRESHSQIRTVISTHHTLFFNVVHNELKNHFRGLTSQYVLAHNRHFGGYVLTEQKGDTPYFHHIAALVELYDVSQNEKIHTYHFNMLRTILEKAAAFHGYGHFSSCIKIAPDDAEGILYQRFVDILSHGKYSLYEPAEMGEETKKYFQKILYEFIDRYSFNPEIFHVEREEEKAR